MRYCTTTWMFTRFSSPVIISDSTGNGRTRVGGPSRIVRKPSSMLRMRSTFTTSSRSTGQGRR